jgi:hypothetical protein
MEFTQNYITIFLHNVVHFQQGKASLSKSVRASAGQNETTSAHMALFEGTSSDTFEYLCPILQ